ncbi:MAG TPA: hypothetical protein PLX89_07535 [Verrucomicrobiota bacterium]|nr:hypothetical protein [Verrucomicrobiales bacterium]HRI12841.1 hypothetical protein [Verrucomicrobiota bacterium]
MKPDTILILEDNEERIAAFELAVAAIDPNLKLQVWHDAPAMIVEAPSWLTRTALISLDHDLNRLPGAIDDPGSGLNVATWLARQQPICPVIIRSSNHDYQSLRKCIQRLRAFWVANPMECGGKQSATPLWNVAKH